MTQVAAHGERFRPCRAECEVCTPGTSRGRTGSFPRLGGKLLPARRGAFPGSAGSFSRLGGWGGAGSVGSVNRKRAYFWLMGGCLLLIVLAWNVVRLFSVPAAVAMSAVAAVIPPTAAIVANWRRGG